MSATEVTVKSKPPPLFALIIGIDQYKQRSLFKRLKGAVADARAVHDYLETSLGVPKSQIKTLFNRNATRDAIIQGLRDLKLDGRIVRGDAILIYYAGHGGTAKASACWEPGGRRIQVLAPYDASYDPGDKTTHGIPDRTIGALLEQIAQEKGNNITVIFDCCFSGSLTREVERCQEPDRIRVRGVQIPYEIPPELDEDIWGGYRGIQTPVGFLERGLRSHVLLSACNEAEVAREANGQGYFTSNLLKTLEIFGADKITYAALVQKIRPTALQSPQCEGHHQNRICFDSKVPVRSSRTYPVRKFDSSYVVAAGTIHGIAVGATFGLYNDRTMVLTQPPDAILIASKPEAFSTILYPPLDTPALNISEEAVARLIEAKYPLLHLAPDETLKSIFETAAEKMQKDDTTQPKLTPVEKEMAELGITPGGEGIVFNILDPRITKYGFERIPFSVPATTESLGTVIRAAGHYYWHLHRSGGTLDLKDKVTVEFTKLEEGEEEYEEDEERYVGGGEHPDLIWKPCGGNLINNGVIDIVVEEDAIYGIKLTNKSNKNLYPYLFYFDNSDLSVTSYFKPPTSPGRVFPPLLAYGSLTIGYGSGGGDPFSCTLCVGQEVEVGFFKLFISTETVDLSAIEQGSAFEGIRGISRGKTRGTKGTWNTLTIPFVQRGHTSP